MPIKRIYNKKIKVNDFLICVLAATMLAVFIFPSWEIVCGPVLAILLTILFFGGYKELTTGIIIVANDALGTIFFGSISFQYLLIALVAIEFLHRRRIKYEKILFMIVGAILTVELFAVGFFGIRVVLFNMIYIFAISIVVNDERSLKKLFFGVAYAVVIIAIHAMLTGGVEYYELNEFSEEILRKGVLGVGIGDSNFSALLLNIGLVCLWYFCDSSWLIKVLATIPIIYSIILTASISGLISLIIVILLGIFLMKKKSKAVVVVGLVVAVLVMAFQIYQWLPEQYHLLELDGYINRVIEKIFAFQEGDMTDVTTNRSDIWSVNIRYIFGEQSFIKLFIGGNTLTAASSYASGHIPHNTYIDFLLQVGLIGTVALLGLIIKRFFAIRKINDIILKKTSIILKVVCLISAFSLSIYQGGIWGIWMLIVFVL